jgi:hypothetical protein
MTKLQFIYKAIRDLKVTTKCNTSDLLVTMNAKTLLKAYKEDNDLGLDQILAAALYGEQLKVFGVDLILTNQYEDNFFTVGFKNKL